jgi:hypothetical protein
MTAPTTTRPRTETPRIAICPDCGETFTARANIKRCRNCAKIAKREQTRASQANYRERIQSAWVAGDSVCDICRHRPRCDVLVHQERVSPICFVDSPEHDKWTE